MTGYKQWITACAALSAVGILAGCATGNNTTGRTAPTNTINQAVTNSATNTSNGKTTTNKTNAVPSDTSAVGTQIPANHTTKHATAPTTSNATGNSSKAGSFSGSNVQLLKGSHTPIAISQGYKGTQPHMTFSNQTFPPIEGFTGTLHGKKFVLDFYSNKPNGIAVGVSYNNKPVYFGNGPSPMFDVLNFSGDNVILGSPSTGAYMAIDLVTGKVNNRIAQVVSMKGYSGITPPNHVLGLSNTQYSVIIPYGSSK